MFQAKAIIQKVQQTFLQKNTIYLVRYDGRSVGQWKNNASVLDS